MKSSIEFILKVSVILVSLLLIDGGRTFFVLHHNVHSNIIHKHNCDLEIPNHEKLADEENWVTSENHEIISPDNTARYIPFNLRFNSREFSKSIWQPPKFI